MKQIIFAFLCSFYVLACSGKSNFNASNAVKGSGKDKGPNSSDGSIGGSSGGDSAIGGSGGGNDALGKDANAPIDPSAFAKKGQSLDAYLIVDVSGSLRNSDPDCLRFEAIKSFKNSLKQVLGDTGDARVSLVTFSDSADFKSTSNNFIGLTDEEFRDKYRSDICRNDSNTNPAAAFDLTVKKMDELQKIEKKKVTSVLFFTDGVPTVGTSQQILSSADALKAKVNSRIFSVLLGTENPSANSVNTIILGRTPIIDPLEFVKYVAGSADRVKSVTNAEALKQAFLAFLGGS
ncbi:MAG: vWA domain-containing protein [Pseudomonadota bacterium]